MIQVVKMVHCRCLRLAMCITLHLTASFDDSWLLATTKLILFDYNDKIRTKSVSISFLQSIFEWNFWRFRLRQNKLVAARARGYLGGGP